MTPTWQDAARWMLQGADLLKPHKRGYFDDNDNPTAACAIGALHYGAVLSGREASLGTHWLATHSDNGMGVATFDLGRRYWANFGCYITTDNDHHGRDYVIDRVKRMLKDDANEAVPS